MDVSEPVQETLTVSGLDVTIQALSEDEIAAIAEPFAEAFVAAFGPHAEVDPFKLLRDEAFARKLTIDLIQRLPELVATVLACGAGNPDQVDQTRALTTMMLLRRIGALTADAHGESSLRHLPVITDTRH